MPESFHESEGLIQIHVMRIPDRAGRLAWLKCVEARELNRTVRLLSVQTLPREQVAQKILGFFRRVGVARLNDLPEHVVRIDHESFEHLGKRGDHVEHRVQKIRPCDPFHARLLDRPGLPGSDRRDDHVPISFGHEHHTADPFREDRVLLVRHRG